MKTRKIQMTTKQLDRLMTDIHAALTEPVGDHLSDDEFIGYAMETLTAEEVQRIDEHLASCADCAEGMEQLVAASEVWRGEQGEQRLAALRQRAFGTRTLLISWSDVAFGIAAEAPTVEDGQVETEHGTLRWRKVKDQAGNLTVRFGSHAMKLDGRRLRLTAGDWQQEVTLGRVAPGQVGVETVITRDEWAQLPDDAVLSVELIREDSEAGSTS